MASHIEVWYKSHILAGEPSFEWDPLKDRANRAKHGVSFAQAQYAFFDPKRVIAEDVGHSARERRYYCFGAGYWRKGKTIYEQQNR